MKTIVTRTLAVLAVVGLSACNHAGKVAEPASVVAAQIAAETWTTKQVGLRGVWITNVDSDILTSKEKIAEGMEALAKAGVNIVYPVVWNKAMTMYPSDHAASVTGTRIDPIYGDRDPLQELIVEAHAHGMEVVPWFEFGFATSYNIGGGVIIKNKPEWAAIDPEGNLVKKNNFEWMNAFDPEVQEFLAKLVLEVAERYDVDGIQGDDRMPALPSLAGYDEATKARYRQETGEDPPADIKEEKWVRWRANILTEWLASLRQRVKAIDPNLTISMSPSYYDWALYEYLQDSYTWTNRGLVDSIHPQAYRYDLDAYKKIVDDLVTNQFNKEQLNLLSPGILVKAGPYVIPEDYFLGAIEYNRQNGITGEVHFFYTGLRENDDKLLNALANGPYKEPARLPYRSQLWRPGMIELQPDGAARQRVNVRSDAPGVELGGLVQSYSVIAPVSASFDLYIRSANGDTSSIAYSLNGTDTGAYDPSTHWGWMSIGSVEAEKGKPVTVTTSTKSASESSPAEVMMLLNRKKSPTAIWK